MQAFRKSPRFSFTFALKLTEIEFMSPWFYRVWWAPSSFRKSPRFSFTLSLSQLRKNSCLPDFTECDEHQALFGSLSDFPSCCPEVNWERIHVSLILQSVMSTKLFSEVSQIILHFALKLQNVTEIEFMSPWFFSVMNAICTCSYFFLAESQSGSSTPTISTAPSSPDHDSSVAVDEGIQTLLKAIELKKLHQVSLPQA